MYEYILETLREFTLDDLKNLQTFCLDILEAIDDVIAEKE